MERDKRTFQNASSLARLGYHSTVVEGEESRLDRDALPLELITAPGATPPPDPDYSKPDELEGPSVGRRIALKLAGTAAMRRALAQQNRRTLEALPPADLIYLTHFLQFPAVAEACERDGAALIYDANDAYWAWPGYRANPRSFRNLLDRTERECVERADGFVTVGDGVAGLIEERYGRRPEVIRNVHDLRLDEPAPFEVRAAAGLGPDDFLLVVVGNEKPSDATAEALEAVAQLPARVHLALIGRGYETYRAAARDLGIEGRVHMMAPVAPTQVTSAIASADAGLIDTRSDDVHLHALPTRLFHSIAAGLPVLYPPLPDVVAIAEEHDLGLPIDPEDPGSVAAAARELAESPERVAELRANAEKARGVLNWEHEERKLIDLVERSLAVR